MEKPISISEMCKFHFGSKVLCLDGEDGSLAQVIFETSSRRLHAIGVRLGFLFGRTVYVPFTAITSATGEGIVLTLSREELAGSSTSMPGGILLDSRSAVQNKNTGDKGALSLVAIEPQSGELAYLVTRGLRTGQDTLLRQEVVKQFSTGLITVSLLEAQLHTLPPYRSDRELLRDVENVLFDLTPLHVDFEGVTIRVLDGVLYLDGNISSELRGEIIGDQSAGVQGLLEVKSNLIGDDQLASDLALILGRDERTRGLPIGVYPRLGVVRLSGVVRNEGQRATAEQITQDFPGVRSVINDLAVKPVIDALNVMTSAFGGGAEDRIPGKYIRHTR